jgi:hypothetical protein
MILVRVLVPVADGEPFDIRLEETERKEKEKKKKKATDTKDREKGWVTRDPPRLI